MDSLQIPDSTGYNILHPEPNTFINMQGAGSVAAVENVSNVDTYMRLRNYVLGADKGFSVRRKGFGVNCSALPCCLLNN